MTRFKGIELLATAGRESKSPAGRCQRHLRGKQHSTSRYGVLLQSRSSTVQLHE
eukprot:CAMPEP_0171946960 /NCGR_PEP_ID=MMETSP0993-20121228/58288_1 /TAXON_ID=483369 /ORGANISM="non described non described, Strain CCMP2098" /LENGTH=53 /DNA_ID=CAMNT_0012590563 /DNA_START=17 /DNA_END=175 /DNA_ORIENTATION=-